MADSKEETGKGANRPYATIDLKATEVGAEADPKPAPRSVPNPWAAALASIRRGQQAMPFLTHVAAGLTGGLLAILAGLLLAGLAESERGGLPQVAALAGRVSELERTASGQSQLPELRNRVDALARSNSMLDAAS